MKNLIETWWTDSQINLVKNSSRIWAKKKFKATSGIWVIKDGNKVLCKFFENEILPSDAIIDKDVWDHEHCALCWTTISENINNQIEGYTDEKDWLCMNCYNKYIASRKEKK